MRITYYQDILTSKPNGIISYMRNLLKYASVEGLEYWSSAVSDESVTFGRNTIRLHNIPLCQTSIGMPARVRHMMAISRARSNMLHPHTPIVVNVNEHVPMLSLKSGSYPIVFVSHGSNHSSMRKTMKLSEYLWTRWFDSAAIRVASRIVVVSMQALHIFQERFPRYAEKIVYIPTFVDDEPFLNSHQSLIRQELGIGLHDLVLCYAGRLSAEKQVDFALKAFAIAKSSVPNAWFVIMGSGPQEAYLRSLAISLGVQNSVLFLGDCDQRKVVSVLSESDISVLLSSFEGTSLFLLESLASGTPIITLDVADHKQILEEKLCGVVLPVDTSHQEVAQRIQQMQLDRCMLSQNALLTAQSYKASVVVPQLENLICSTVAS